MVPWWRHIYDMGWRYAVRHVLTRYESCGPRCCYKHRMSCIACWCDCNGDGGYLEGWRARGALAVEGFFYWLIGNLTGATKMRFRGYTKEEQARRENFQGRAWNVMKSHEAGIRARLGLDPKDKIPADVNNLDSVYEGELSRLQAGRAALSEALEVECAAAAVALDRLQDAEAYAQIKAMRSGAGKLRALRLLEDGIKDSLVFPDGFPAAQDAPRAVAA